MFVVTGGGTGIGRALAKNLAARNKEVFIVGRREDLLLETASLSLLIKYLVADVSTSDGRNKVATVLQSQEKISGLIHNAGVIEPITPIQRIKEKDWRQTMATNLEAPLFLTQLLYEKLMGGRVLNIGSGAAHFPVTDWAAYCVSKAALYMLTQSWSLESTNVHFASVRPGIVDTPMQAKIRSAEGMEAAKKDFFIELKNSNKLLTSETVAVFLSWLLLDIPENRYVDKEWDIYETTHHREWLRSPHIVPKLET